MLADRSHRSQDGAVGICNAAPIVILGLATRSPVLYPGAIFLTAGMSRSPDSGGDLQWGASRRVWSSPLKPLPSSAVWPRDSLPLPISGMSVARRFFRRQVAARTSSTSPTASATRRFTRRSCANHPALSTSQILTMSDDKLVKIPDLMTFDPAQDGILRDQAKLHLRNHGG